MTVSEAINRIKDLKRLGVRWKCLDVALEVMEGRQKKMDDNYIPSCADCKYFRKCKEEENGSSRFFHICDVEYHLPDQGRATCIVVPRNGCCELFTEQGEQG